MSRSEVLEYWACEACSFVWATRDGSELRSIAADPPPEKIRMTTGPSPSRDDVMELALTVIGATLLVLGIVTFF